MIKAVWVRQARVILVEIWDDQGLLGRTGSLSESSECFFLGSAQVHAEAQAAPVQSFSRFQMPQ